MSSWIQKCTSAKKEEVQSTNTGRTQDVCRHMTHIIPIYKRFEMLASPWFERLGRPHSAQSSQVSHPTSMPAIRRCVYKSEKHLQISHCAGQTNACVNTFHQLVSMYYLASASRNLTNSMSPGGAKAKRQAFLFLPVAP